MAEGHDLFISHASEDKNKIVEPLVEELENRGLEVWYDEFELELGDSLIDSVTKGLRNSRCGVIILSEAFFGKNWTETEKDVLKFRLVESDMKVVPLWYGIDESDVREYDPVLADRLAKEIDEENISDVASEICGIIGGERSNLPTISIICWDEAIYENILSRFNTVNSATNTELLEKGIIKDGSEAIFNFVVGYPSNKSNSLTIQKTIRDEVDSELLITLGTATGLQDTNTCDVVVANPFRGYSDSVNGIIARPSRKIDPIMESAVEYMQNHWWVNYTNIESPKRGAEIRVGSVASAGSLIKSEEEFMNYLLNKTGCVAVSFGRPEFFEWIDNLKMNYLMAFVIQNKHNLSKESYDTTSEYAVSFLRSFIDYVATTRDTFNV